MKISEPVLKEIRSMMHEGLSDTEIGRRVGCSQQAVSYYRGKWKLREQNPNGEEQRQKRLSLCWECAHAVPDTRGHGCSWSRDFEPVEGWTAKEGRYFSQKDGKRVANVMYGVQACPLFERG